MAGIINELRQREFLAPKRSVASIACVLGGSVALSAVQRLVQSEYIETALAPALLEIVADNKADIALRVPSFLALAKLCHNEDISLYPIDPLELALTASKQLDNSDIRMQAAASLTLTNLTQHEMALDEPVLQQVMSSLENIEHEGIQRAVLGYIGNAAVTAEARQILINETNCVEKLSELIQSGRGEPVRSAAAFTIGNLLSGRDIHAQNMLREVGGLPDLILLLSPAYKEDTNECSAWAISHGVHRNALSQDLVGEAGGIGMLVHHLLSSNNDLRRNAILALYSSAANHKDNIDRCKRNNGEAIVEQMLNDASPECREYATLLLQEF